MPDNKKCIADLHDLPKETFRKIMRQVNEAKAVDYSARDGAICPACGAMKCPITKSNKWERTVKGRYHRCTYCGHRFKSIQEAA